MKKILLFCLVFAAHFTILPAYERLQIQWHSDLEEATELASEIHKPIFLLFTGSGWCPYCVKLETAVLSVSQFAERVGDQFIFVKIDVPRGKRIRERKDPLLRKYKVESVPTVIILDPDLNSIAKTDSRGADLWEYISYLENLLRN